MKASNHSTPTSIVHVTAKRTRKRKIRRRKRRTVVISNSIFSSIFRELCFLDDEEEEKEAKVEDPKPEENNTSEGELNSRSGSEDDEAGVSVQNIYIFSFNVLGTSRLTSRTAAFAETSTTKG